MKLKKQLDEIEVKYKGEVLNFTLREMKASEIIDYSTRLFECAKSKDKLAALRVEYGAAIIHAFPDDQFTDENDNPIKCDEAGKTKLKELAEVVLMNIAIRFIDMKMNVDISAKGESPLPLSNSSANGSELAQPKNETDVLKIPEDLKKD